MTMLLDLFELLLIYVAVFTVCIITPIFLFRLLGILLGAV